MRCRGHSIFDRQTTRRDFLRLAICGSGAALVPLDLGRLFGASLDVTRVSRMDFDVTYTTRVMNLPDESRTLRIWIPVPPASREQEITGLSISSPVPHEDRTEKIFRNRIVFVESDTDPVPFPVSIRYRVTRRRSRIEPVELGEREKVKYLTLTPRVKVTDDIREFTDKIVGSERSPAVIGRRVFDALNEILYYDKTIPGCGTGDTEWIYKHRRGKCDDYHSLFMAMMISRRIPVRWEQGFPLPYPTADQVESGKLEGDCSGAHCWASFFDRERGGWIPVDVSEADRHPELADFFFGNLTPNRFKISEGRNIVLDPAQAGDPLNSLAYAYAEADGIPLIYKANYENTIEYTVNRIEMERLGSTLIK